MVVKAKEVMEESMRRNKNILRALEKKIDDALIDGGRCIAVDVLGNIDRAVLERFLTAYRQAGWQVTYECDQRDGDYLKFSVTEGRR